MIVNWIPREQRQAESATFQRVAHSPPPPRIRRGTAGPGAWPRATAEGRAPRGSLRGGGLGGRLPSPTTGHWLRDRSDTGGEGKGSEGNSHTGRLTRGGGGVGRGAGALWPHGQYTGRIQRFAQCPPRGERGVGLGWQLSWGLAAGLGLDPPKGVGVQLFSHFQR